MLKLCVDCLHFRQLRCWEKRSACSPVDGQSARAIDMRTDPAYCGMTGKWWKEAKRSVVWDALTLEEDQ